MEYTEFAKYYDKFYQKKDYLSEVNFLRELIPSGSNILDLGCGTGRHGSLLEEMGYTVDGLDSSYEMLEVAKERIHGEIYQQNILDINIDKKYCSIISMFAVFNHLKNLEELEIAFRNVSSLLSSNGIFILDLHNPQDSGKKIDKYLDMERIMEWDFDRENRIEKTDITYIVDDITYKDSHVFRIFTIREILECSKRVGLIVDGIYEDYQVMRSGSEKSKNLQFVFRK